MPAVLPPQQQYPPGPASELHFDAYDGSIQLMVSLLARGSLDINQGTLEGATPLMTGARQGHSSIVRILLNTGADTKVVDDTGFTTLHSAITAWLVEAGADLEATNDDRITALHLAMFKGYLGVVVVLVEAGEDVHATNSTGETPLHQMSKQTTLWAARLFT